MGKYDPLRDHLIRTGDGSVEMHFDEVAALVGGLPASAFEYREWWANSRGSHVEADAWLDAGRTVEEVNLTAR